ncbi:MAG: DUF1501 domain-containing protein [Acidimicrobiales bacterium]
MESRVLPGPSATAQGRGIAGPKGTLVVVNLVGGLDGLSLLVPFADRTYAARRPGLAVASPGDRYGAIDLGRGLGLHPALQPLYELAGRSDRLAVIGGVGVPDDQGGNRNHLPSREFVHRGGRQQSEGWATRLLRFEGMGPEAVWSFGDGPHPMFDGLSSGHVGGGVGPIRPVTVGAQAACAGVPLGAPTAAAAAPDAALDDIRWSDARWSSPADRLARGYPEGHLGRCLATIVDMRRSDAGLRLVGIDHAGYDTHVDQGDGRSGVLAHKLDRLARALAAFWSEVSRGRDVEARRDDPVTVVVVSEFGRAIDENGSGGTEHGRGGVALAIGDQVVGGVHGDLPSMADDEVWPVGVDVRRVLADAAASHGFRPWRGAVFPGLSLPNRSLGLLLSP